MEKEKENTVEYTYEFTDVKTVKLNFDKLCDWINPETGLPICSCISLYTATGLLGAIEEYSKAHSNASITPYDNLVCSFATLDHIKNFLKKQWGIYSLDIDKDNHVFWETKKFPAGVKHYQRKLRKRIEACIVQDFANYCCGNDEDVPDDEIVFRTFVKVKKTEGAQDEGKEVRD